MYINPEEDPFDLTRFLLAQADTYAQVLAELKAGRKRTHWIWYIFPQYAGLGSSENSVLYAIKSLEEARAYLLHPVLGHRLNICSTALLQHSGLSAKDIMGSPDDQKLQSCMTLYSRTEGTNGIFNQVLAKYYAGRPDTKTLTLLGLPDSDA
ncbi:DUF1810 domain-containing protein [Lacunisphaera limnophila]|uniref:DUF1810 domain-containing protein n=1 Tax=Lacunisphaera limnophila TaxID=1838286 RepID=UPI0008599778|nr:DUF1810 domain-containing protein [Lacunisphaera limnophila]